MYVAGHQTIRPETITFVNGKWRTEKGVIPAVALLKAQVVIRKDRTGYRSATIFIRSKTGVIVRVFTVRDGKAIIRYVNLANTTFKTL